MSRFTPKLAENADLFRAHIQGAVTHAPSPPAGVYRLAALWLLHPQRISHGRPPFQRQQKTIIRPAQLWESVTERTKGALSHMRIATRYLISGRVQGVGFRFFTQAIADREQIDGWVRNTPDGSVEVEAEGEARAMMRFEEAIRSGPMGARVDRIEVTVTVPGANGTGFLIR